MGKAAELRLDSEMAIMRTVLELLQTGVSRERVEQELVRRTPVDLDLLSSVIRRIDSTGAVQRQGAQ